MNKIKKPKIWTACYLAMVALLWSSTGVAADKLTNLSQVPLANDAGSLVRPNMMFVLDNSGSMDFSYMPDYVGYSNGTASDPSKKCRRYATGSSSSSTTCAGIRNDGGALTEGGDPPVFSPQFNTIYYNPEIRYAPPVSPCDPSQTLPSMTAGNSSNWTAVAIQGHQINDICSQTSGTTNLVTGYPERVYCNSLSATSLSDCRRNGINASTAYPGDYDYPDNIKGSSVSASTPINWYADYGTSNSSNPLRGSYPYGRTYASSNPHYFLIAPLEHCTDESLVSCVLSATPTTSNPVPAYVRACKSEAFASDTAAVSGNFSGSAKCQARFTFTAGGYTYARYGSFKRVDIVSGTNSYNKGTARTDCSGTTCSYADEMTNFANWYAYYRTRMQSMKSATGRAFGTIDDAYRVGFITINPGSPVADSKYLSIKDFTSTQKTSWYKKLYAQDPSGGTPLRQALSRVGRHFANKTDGINSGMTGDPVQYECQQNFALLTTDGYWNGSQGVQVDGLSAINNQDNADSGYSTRSVGAFDGNLSGASNTLADVAMYYYKTDLRSDFGDLVPTTDKDKAKHQHMTTFTLGLGLNGELTYRPDYEMATSGDFSAIKAGTKNWPVPAADSASALDDLWHAAVNGRGAYFSAKDPASLVSGIQGALGAVTVRTGAAAASATSSPNITPSDNFIYSSTYRTLFWDGEVVAKTIDTQTGVVSTANVWSAQASLDGKVGASNDSRVIYKADMDTATPLLETFIWTNLNDAEKDFFRNKCALLSQCSVLNTTTQAIANNGEAMLAFLRGQTGNENAGAIATADKAFRDREHALGDTVNATPAFVKVPRFNFTDNVSPEYAQFKSNNASRQGALYIAANDGMLHALNSDNGAEMWAYVPKAVMPNMHKLADKNYSAKHKYFVDGSPQTMDIFAAGGWKTIVVGGLNAGGRGYYALDVTTPASPKVLWEFCHDATLCSVSDSDLGYTYGNPVIAKLPSGQWVVMVTSGYNNVAPGNGKGYLYVLNATTGAILQKVSTGVGDTGLPVDDAAKTGPSGLAKISAWADLGDLDATATHVYGGDLFGNLWRFDMSSSPATVTKVASLKEPGGAAQPITTKPELGKVPGVTERVVFVGTGQYLGEPDLADAKKQSIYAIRDTGTTYTNPRTVLTPRTISQGGANATIAGGSVDWANGGWYADFPESKERVNIDPQLVLGTLVVATATPSGNSCSVGGTSWIYQFDFATGLAVPGMSSVGQQNSAGLIVGIVIFRLPTGQLKGVSTAGDGTQNTFGVNLNSAGTGSKRTGWRELTQ